MNVGLRGTVDSLKLTGIWPKEIKATKKRIKIGSKFTMMDIRQPNKTGDGYGALVKAKVIAKFPHIVCFDNGMSATYAQMAIYYRNKHRKRYMS